MPGPSPPGPRPSPSRGRRGPGGRGPRGNKALLTFRAAGAGRGGTPAAAAAAAPLPAAPRPPRPLPAAAPGPAPPLPPRPPEKAAPGLLRPGPGPRPAGRPSRRYPAEPSRPHLTPPAAVAAAVWASLAPGVRRRGRQQRRLLLAESHGPAPLEQSGLRLGRCRASQLRFGAAGGSQSEAVEDTPRRARLRPGGRMPIGVCDVSGGARPLFLRLFQGRGRAEATWRRLRQSPATPGTHSLPTPRVARPPPRVGRTRSLPASGPSSQSPGGLGASSGLTHLPFPIAPWVASHRQECEH